ncbi:competence protein ComEC [Cytobacillus eiseniae]|uniref:Competence protein ComEC n=1 Tax=Cytobacillus eiseniae TaxID=762947 RepID=A0ABS4RH96_9BACI|nr:competence protein ComEC [Cytobacillus eiseniae]
MKGKWIYFTFAGLIGILAAFNFLLVFLFFFGFYLLFLAKGKGFSKKFLTISSCVFLLFFLRTELLEKGNQTKLSEQDTQFYIEISDEIKVDGNRFSAMGRELLHKEKIVLSYQIKTEKEKAYLSDKLTTSLACKVKGKLSEPNTSTNVNAFNYQQYLKGKQIHWILQIEEFTPLNCTTQKKTLLSFFRTLRENGIQYVQTHFPEEMAPLSTALLFGERGYIDNDVLASYEKLGIVHLLAISGLHVGLLAGMLFFAGIRLGIARETMTSILLLFLPCYALLTGAAPSVIRAVFMMVLYLALHKWLVWSLSKIDIISIVFIVYSLFTPYVIFDVGFQLSFSVSFVLILSAAFLLQRFTNPIILLFCTSFICQLASIPIMLYYFYEVSLLSIFANAIFIPLFSIVILPAIILVFLLHLLFGTKIAFLILPLHILIVLMDKLAIQLSLLPFAIFTLGRPSAWVLLLYLCCIPYFFVLWERGKGKKHFLKIIILPLSLFLFHGYGNNLSPYGEITFIDVGQGDSIFIQMPFGKGNILIDAGGTIDFDTEEWKKRQKQYEVGKDVVVPFLKSKGVRVIDKLIITHGDADHMGGAFEVMDQLKVKELVLPKRASLSELEVDLLQLAKSNQVPWKFTIAGDRWKTGDSVFHVLAPLAGMEESERNDGSIVLLTKIGGASWLFTGDLEKEGEERLLTQYKNLKTHVLKAGHHGSKTSTTPAFLNRIEPKVAIISAGRNNRYGHPNQEVIDELTERRIKILRTDLHGAITYFFKGDSGTFSTQLP